MSDPVDNSKSVLEFMKAQRHENNVFRTRMLIMGIALTIGTYIYVMRKHRVLIEKMDSDVGEGLPKQARKFTGHKSSGQRIAFALEFPAYSSLLGYNNPYTPYFVYIVATYYEEASTAQLVHLVFELENMPAIVTDRYEHTPCEKGDSTRICITQNQLYSGGDTNEGSPNLFQQSVNRIFATKASWLERASTSDFKPPPEPENAFMHIFKQAAPFINMAMMAAMMGGA